MHARILLLREAAQQMSSSGCCGRIEGEAAEWGRAGTIFPERRAEMERAGRIYRSLREHFGGSVELQVIDPRNLISWFPLAVADMWRFHRSLRPLPRLLVGLRRSGIIINGKLAFADLPPAEQVVAQVERAMRGAE